MIWGRMIPTYSGGATGLEAFRRLAWLQPGFLGTATMALAFAAEVIVVAILVLVWRDAARGEEDKAEELNGQARVERRPWGRRRVRLELRRRQAAE